MKDQERSKQCMMKSVGFIGGVVSHHWYCKKNKNRRKKNEFYNII